jgi:hypothetical protein
MRSIWMPGASIGARNIVAPAGPRSSLSLLRHDDREFGADRAGDQPFLAVDDEIALVAAGVSARGRQQHRRVGPGTRRRLGHHKARADVAGGERAQIFFLSAAPRRPAPANAYWLRRARSSSSRWDRAANTPRPRTPPPCRDGRDPARPIRGRHAATTSPRAGRAPPARGETPRSVRARRAACRSRAGSSRRARKRSVRSRSWRSSSEIAKSMTPPHRHNFATVDEIKHPRRTMRN